MLKFITKQFLYGRFFLWLKERIGGLFLTAILLILVFYIHSEYLNYFEFKSQNDGSYIGLSFIIKNILIIGIVLGYLFFYKTMNKTKLSIKETKENIIKESNNKDKEKVTSLDQFLNSDELDK